MSIRARFREFIRNFPQNGMKLLLEDPANVRDLLRILDYPEIDRIAFDAMTVERTTYVAPDYRHVEADVVLSAPFRISESRQSRKRITLYVLIEHQSEPDRFMVFRVLEYVVQIYKAQMRDWVHEHGNASEFEFQPVLPIVFYTGKRSWKRLRRFAELTAGQELLGRVLPTIRPLFLNLSAIPVARLRQAGLSFARILELFRERDVDYEDLQGLLSEIMHDLQDLPRHEHERWLNLMNYLIAMVYHYREADEQPRLLGIIDQSVADDVKKEIEMIKRTGAEAFRDEGGLRDLRSALRELLLVKFGNVPAAVTARIKNEPDRGVITEWMKNVVKAKRLADVGIPTS